MGCLCPVVLPCALLPTQAHSAACSATHLSRYSYMLNYPSRYTHSHARRWTLILVSQTEVLSQSATPVSSRQGMLFLLGGNTDLCSVFAQPPISSQGHGVKVVMPPAMWRKMVHVDTSFLQPIHALRSAFERWVPVSLCLVLPFSGIKDHLIVISWLDFQVSFLDLPPRQAVILRFVMTAMRNFEAKPLLEALSHTHA